MYVCHDVNEHSANSQLPGRFELCISLPSERALLSELLGDAQFNACTVASHDGKLASSFFLNQPILQSQLRRAAHLEQELFQCGIIVIRGASAAAVRPFSFKLEIGRPAALVWFSAGARLEAAR
jgi:hypothetical protein